MHGQKCPFSAAESPGAGIANCSQFLKILTTWRCDRCVLPTITLRIEYQALAWSEVSILLAVKFTDAGIPDYSRFSEF